MRPWFAPLAFTLVTACGGSPDAGGSFGTGGTGDTDGEDSETSDATGTTDATAGGTGSTGEDPTKFDLGVPDMPPGGEGCSKVDFLFVVDNSTSMQGNQANLVENFPAFVDEIEATLSDVDSYHVGVITTDDYFGNDPACIQYGALVTQTAGEASSLADCAPFAGGKRFMTEADDLATKFACAAQPGINGSTEEQHARALTEALSPALNAAGACNDGFLRDDALLVVVIITDEDDKSPGTPGQWFADIAAAKGGVEENVVLLSFVSTVDTMYPSSCVFEAFTSTKVIELTEMFTHGFIGDVCEDYGTLFHDAINLISESCDAFVPAG